MKKQTQKEYEATQKILIKMFKKVGLDFNYTQIKEYCKTTNWYRTKHWTDKEQYKFKQWMIKYIRKHLKYAKYKAEQEAAWFLLSYGWTTKT